MFAFRRMGRAFLLCSLGCLGAVSSPAQTPADTARHTFSFRQVALAGALQTVADHAGIDLVYDAALVARKTTTCTITDAQVPAVLDCVLRGTGVAWAQRPSGVYVLRKAAPASRSSARPPVAFSGYVRDAETGESLIGATLYVPAWQRGTTTNAYGFFSLSAPADSMTVRVSYVGYQTVVLRLAEVPAAPVSLALPPATVGLEGLTVEADLLEMQAQQTRMSAIAVPIEQVEAIPALLGEVDLVKALQLLPGVKAGYEASSGLSVRGGSPDQNLVLLDGAPLYNVAHLFGYLSIFNSDALHNVELIKGGFPARYGGRLSAILDVSMKEGNLRRFGGQAHVGLLSSHLMVEGPVWRDRTSFMVAGRRSFLDLLAPGLTDEDVPNAYFYDLNAKLNHRFSARDRVFLSYYGGRDVFNREGVRARVESAAARRNEAKLDLGWGNTVGTLRWNHLFSPRLFGNLLLLYSDYDFHSAEEHRLTETTGDLVETTFSFRRYESGIRDVGARLDFDAYPHAAHTLRFGASAMHHTYRTGTRQLVERYEREAQQDTVFTPQDRVTAWEGQLYLEDDLRVSDRLQLNLGLHASAYAVEGTAYGSLEPRLAARYQLTDAWHVKASYVRMRQYVHLLTNSGLGLPTDLWVPSTPRVQPERSQQLALGVGRTFPQGFLVTLEGYYKTLSNLIAYQDGANFLSLDKSWQDNVATGGRGRSYGAELFVQKTQGRLTGWVGYTLAWANRRFDEVNFGRTFPFKFDRRHDLAATAAYRLSRTLTLSGTWAYTSGQAVTLPVGRYDETQVFDLSGIITNAPLKLTEYGGRNRFRMAAYHRLDLGVTWTLRQRRLGHELRLGGYNVYSRKNPLFYTVDTDFSPSGHLISVVRQTSLPILPAFSYVLSF